ncbi:MarC family protein [Vannielia litorea]|uniref:MarC family protein n=1 Tax=Vannielia litorea TaxID=1217970 RepID=UPI001BCC6C9C|nr:MarC family protein [Vannielia litorea]MBS8228841.1 MarC family protein [Vannielia litorea]
MLPFDQLLQEFITLWVVIDPIGTVPVFLAVTAGMTVRARRKVALKAVAVAALVLLAFMIAGQIILEALGLGLPSFQIAGGLVLFLFALSMIFGPGKPEAELAEAEESTTQTAIHPVAIPSIASPGAMLAVVVLTDNDRFSLAHQAQTGIILLVILTITLAFLYLASPILKLIGPAGASIISRVMGMILAAVAVDAVLRGLVQIGALAPF